MPGLGTIINVVLLVAGGLLGLAGGRFITPRIQNTVMKASGLCVLFIGLGGTMQKMLIIDGKALATTGTTMLIVSFASVRSSARPSTWRPPSRTLANGSSARLAVRAITSSPTLLSRLHSPCASAPWPLWDRSRTACSFGDWSTLALKGALDCIIVYHDGVARPRLHLLGPARAVFQGTITLFAGALSPIMTTAALNSLSLVGSMLIFCVGVNLIRPQTFRTANMLPSVVIAVIYALLF